MTRLRLVSFVLASALIPATAVLAMDPPADAPAKPPTRAPGGGTGDGVKGPKVPGDATKGDSQFGRGRMAMQDARVWNQALDQMLGELSPDQKTKIEAIRSEFKKSAEEWQKANGERMKELQGKVRDSLKNGGKPDQAVADEMKKLTDSRPRPEASQEKVLALPTPDQQTKFKANLASLQAQAEKRRKEARDGKGDEMGPDGKGGRGGDGTFPPGRGKGGKGGKGGDGSSGGSGGTGGTGGSGGSGGNGRSGG